LFEIVCIKFVPNFRFRATELKKILIADRQRDTDRQTYIDRQTYRETDSQAGRQTDISTFR
jgi:hypothetical protein